MVKSKNSAITGFLALFMLSVLLTPYLSSCGKGTQGNVVGTNVQLEVLNLSPDVHPVNLYMHYIKQNTYPYYYPTPSGYFYLGNIDTPLQVRSAAISTQNLYSISQPGFQSNHKYTLFITGQYLPDSTVKAFVTRDDTASTPPIGFGKIRFINMAWPNTPIDVVANGTAAFSKIGYDSVAKYIVMPVGNYIFQMNPSSTPGSYISTTLSTTPTTIQDGRLYTLYSYGIVGRTDTSAFNAGVLINR